MIHAMSRIPVGRTRKILSELPLAPVAYPYRAGAERLPRMAALGISVNRGKPHSPTSARPLTSLCFEGLYST